MLRILMASNPPRSLAPRLYSLDTTVSLLKKLHDLQGGPSSDDRDFPSDSKTCQIENKSHQDRSVPSLKPKPYTISHVSYNISHNDYINPANVINQLTPDTLPRRNGGWAPIRPTVISVSNDGRVYGQGQTTNV